MAAYYNEFDPFAAQWLRNLIAAALIAPGDVDERSIADVMPDDLRGYTQCHFFAGIGGWSYALRLALWPDDRPVWTGSCPCQPFSAAGKRKGFDDERHLWPEFRRLIAECGPSTVFGEQVASRDGRNWLAGVRVDLEALGYAVGAADLCAAGIGAPHIRQRLWWVADGTTDGRREERALARGLASGGRPEGWAAGFVSGGAPRRVADTDEGQRGRLANGEGRERDRTPTGRQQSDGIAQSGGNPRRLAHSHGGQSGDGHLQRSGQHGLQPQDGGAGGMGDADRPSLERLRPVGVSMEPEQEAGRSGHADPWAGSHSLRCSDGKARRVEPSIFPLAHGLPNRMGILRGAGNAIVPQVAAAFIRAADQAMTEAA